MKITIDGKKVDFNENDKNIVDAAKKADITIVAPCYNAKRKKGCCKACVIEIDGQQQYACATKPVDGMDITYNREDLNQLRKERIKYYRDNPGTPCCSEDGGGCDCSTNPPISDSIDMKKSSCCN